MSRMRPERLILAAVAFHRLQSAGGSRLNNAAPGGSTQPPPRSLAASSSSRASSASASLEAIAGALDTASLHGSVSSVLHEMHGLGHAGPSWIASWAKPMPKCVASVNATLTKLERNYGKPQVPSLLLHSCDSAAVVADVGGTKPACETLMRDLGKVYGECGDQNYYTWCRNLYLNSSTIVKEKQQQWMNNSNISMLRHQCSQKCPEIADIIMDYAVSTSVVQDLMAHFESGPSSGASSWTSLLVEQLELIFRMDNRMCDNVHFAKAPCARPSLMSESCVQMEDAMKLWFLNGVVTDKFDECDARQPCRDDCEGVDAKRVDYFAALLRMVSKAVPTYAEGRALCDAIPPMQKCAAQPSCTKYLSFEPAVATHDLAQQHKHFCADVFLDGCYQVQEKKCFREIEKLNNPFKDKATHCLEVLGTAEMFSDEDVTTCCQASLDLANCNARNWCHGLMEKEINATGLTPKFESLCPQVLWALTTTTTPPPFDCDAGLVNWERGWSMEKKEWCCDNEVKGCGLFDCQAGLTNWERGWSEEKQVWCCANDGLGCTTTPPPDLFDCHAGLNNWKLGWSHAKKDWCCSNKHLGCPGQPSPGVGHKSPLV